jgi:hypothetical protein
MAEIKVNLKADDSDVKAKFKEAGAAAKEFADHVKEQFAQIKETTADIAGEAGFGGVKKVLEGLGAVYFGAQIVEGFKKAAEAAIDFEKTVAGLETALGPAFAGLATSWAKRIEEISGAMGSFEENVAVFQGLLHAGLIPQDAFDTLINIQNAAKATGHEVGELGEAFAAMKEEGKLPERFWKQFPELAPIARGLGGGEAPTVDWMFKTLLPAIAPGGLQAPVRARTQATAAGELADLGEKFHELSEDLGTAILPTIKDFANWVKANLPEITEDFKKFGEGLAGPLEWIKKNLGWLGSDIVANRYPGQRTVEEWHSMLFSTAPPDPTMHYNLFHDSATALDRSHKAQINAAEKIDAAADKLNKALNPK